MCGAKNRRSGGRVPQWGPGAKLMVRGQGAEPPEADDILAFYTHIFFTL